MAPRTQTSLVPTRATSLSPSAATTRGPQTSRPRTGRPRTGRPRTGLSSLAGQDPQHVVCAVSESRGPSPTVGLAFVNLDGGEAILCQVSDSQTYVRTLHKLQLLSPTDILVVKTAAEPPKTKLCLLLEETLQPAGACVVPWERRHFAEAAGIEYITELAFLDDVDAIKTALAGSFYAVCCFSAVMRYIEAHYSTSFAPHSLNVKYEPSEGAMMIDLSTIYSLELIQNLRDAKSRDCLFGLLNETQTPMGARLLRSNILQPLTAASTIQSRWDALDELSSKEHVFFGVQRALQGFLDVDRLLSSITTVQLFPTIEAAEQNINNVIMLRQFAAAVRRIHAALANVSSALLQKVREHCAPSRIEGVEVLINGVINDDVRYSKNPLDLRYQRAFAIRSGVNGLLDASRTTFKEGSEDACAHRDELRHAHNLSVELKYDSKRQFYLRLPQSALEGSTLPADFINVVRRHKTVECSTLKLVKQNQKGSLGKIVDSHNECIMMSDEMVRALIDEIRTHASAMFKMCESVALLDVLWAFAQLVTTLDYVRPEISETLGVQGGRHAIKERGLTTTFVANDVYATRQRRVQIVTGCNMSGKSTYIRSVALMVVMAQIGCFVPARYAAFPIHHQLFARVNVDDSSEACVSTYAGEMQEAAYMLHNIGRRSIAIVDELGRGTSTRDGLAMAVAVAEALAESGATVWFATHLTELTEILAERVGVTSLHMVVESGGAERLKMLYRVAGGAETTPSYGLSIARLVPLPTRVLTRASETAGELQQRSRRRRRSREAATTQRRRRLVLQLREHLEQAKSSSMDGDVLREHLGQLQREFVRSMMEADEDNEGDGGEW